jgi:SSS family solute:Na+ symporter
MHVPAQEVFHGLVEEKLQIESTRIGQDERTRTTMDVAVIAIYIVAMIGIGWLAKRRVRNDEDFLVAGRRLGPMLYGGTLAAIVLGGASTIGGVRLGYRYGISGMWLVFSIGSGILLLSLAFAGRINRLNVYTVSEMLELRYGPGTRLFSGIVMCSYALMLCVVSTIAYSAILSVIFGAGKIPTMIIGGGVVILYSMLGGMWSITLTDFAQFVIKTTGIFVILLPILLFKTGGISGFASQLPRSAFSPTTIGGGAILAYFVTYFFGLLIGQDIWQRVFTARSDRVAKWAGAAAGVYCLLYALAGALIGMAAKILLPGIADQDDVYAIVVTRELPVGISGLVIAAALAAIMSTSSGALIAAATVAKEDIVSRWPRSSYNRARDGEPLPVPSDHGRREVENSRAYILVFGVLGIALACSLRDILAALTIAYDILVGGLLVAIVGGIVWQRGTVRGAQASMFVGSAATLAALALRGNIYASMPILVGLVASLVTYAIGSLLSDPTSPQIVSRWQARIEGNAPMQ